MRIKHLIRAAVTASAALAASTASAQYYQMANQLPQLISPALSGSLNYKGFVELSGLAGLGGSRANDISLTTSQGFRYSSWFFMGVGAGIDVMMARRDRPDINDGPTFDAVSSSTKTRAMIPLFSDFRFNIGAVSNASFFIDIKLGAAWLLGGNLYMDDGYLGTDTQFFLRPSAGVRLPVAAGDTRHAVNIGVTYQLLTSDNNSYYGNYGYGSATLNNLGVSVSYEW